jgi:hypothetical protein
MDHEHTQPSKKPFPKADEHKPASLYLISLAYQQEPWCEGEKKQIWRNADASWIAYLQEQGGRICLFISYFPEVTCVIFEQEPLWGSWFVVDEAADNYTRWVQRIKMKIDARKSKSLNARSQSKNARSSRNNYEVLRSKAV